MNRFILEHYYRELKKKGGRITKARKAILGALTERVLSFEQLYQILCEAGFQNQSTFYNNLNFFVQEKVLREIVIANTKYYDLILEKNNRFAADHVYVLNEVTGEVAELLSVPLLQIIKEALPDQLDIQNIVVAIVSKN